VLSSELSTKLVPERGEKRGESRKAKKEALINPWTSAAHVLVTGSVSVLRLWNKKRWLTLMNENVEL
jgi:hypothetical protein